VTGSLWHVLAALLAFLITHSIPALRPVRARCVSVLGERGYLIAHSTLSIAVITWVVLALVDAPYVELWPMTVAAMWLTVLLMIPATAFLVFGLTTPNPFSIPIRTEAFVPEFLGILTVTRHPLLMGLAFWSLAHIPPNGSVATIMMFGFTGAFSIAGMDIEDFWFPGVRGSHAFAIDKSNVVFFGDYENRNRLHCYQLHESERSTKEKIVEVFDENGHVPEISYLTGRSDKIFFVSQSKVYVVSVRDALNA